MYDLHASIDFSQCHQECANSWNDSVASLAVFTFM